MKFQQQQSHPKLIEWFLKGFDSMGKMKHTVPHLYKRFYDKVYQ